MQAVIYAFRSPDSGAVYIGKHECNPEGWPRRGNGRLPDGYPGRGKVVERFHRKHGAAVQWRILAIVPLEEWPRAEGRAVDLARAIFGRKCVNIRDGGRGGTRADALRMWADPGHRAKTSAAIKDASNRPEARARLSAAARALWQDPERVGAAIKEAVSQSEVKARRSAAQRQAFAQPEVKARLVAGQKAGWAVPGVRARRSAAIKEAANQPEVIAKRKATKLRNFIRAANARNRARREAAMEAPQ